MEDTPRAVLFCCTMNAIRSPMAEAILRHYHGRRLYVTSVGIKPAEIDGFAVTVMEEIGLDISGHVAKTFAELDDSSFDLIVSLTPEAQHQAVEMTRTMACRVEYWKTFDPSIIEGSRETRLEAYREVRQSLLERILRRFSQDQIIPTI